MKKMNNDTQPTNKQGTKTHTLTKVDYNLLLNLTEHQKLDL